MTELCRQTARELTAVARSGEASVYEIVEAHLERIDQVNPIVNAICTLEPEKALTQAREADCRKRRGDELGPLHGLPIAVKDLVPTAGTRTTFGSPIYRDFVPEHDALIVQRLRAAGAIVIGKTNTPEFGAGSQTFNQVFGRTRNPWDTSKTCGGSSGGAAAALASGMLPIADGSDLGGSLRNPASFCGVVGFRPSPGRVPNVLEPPGDIPDLAWDDLSVLGPMARNVEDLALLLSAIAGPDPRSPIALAEPGESFRQVQPKDLSGLRIAWTPDLDRYRVDSRVAEICGTAAETFEVQGATVEQAAPDLSGVDDIFQVLRAWLFAHKLKANLEQHRELLKEAVIWNTEKGLELSGTDVARAYAERTRLFQRVVRFFQGYDALVMPTVQVLPFDVETEYPAEIEGHPMANYLEWMGTCYAITVTRCPAISVPCGFSDEGLPVGLQIVAPPLRDSTALEIALAFTQARPIEPLAPVDAEAQSSPS